MKYMSACGHFSLAGEVGATNFHAGDGFDFPVLGSEIQRFEFRNFRIPKLLGKQQEIVDF